ncbi:hypothetical protein B0H13DRAFT_2263343 [Mycena leptocephala]|nr:hypothetical protein B0H13DRAFT_2263343 [Mycena leptocephala]
MYLANMPRSRKSHQIWQWFLRLGIQRSGIGNFFHLGNLRIPLALDFHHPLLALVVFVGCYPRLVSRLQCTLRCDGLNPLCEAYILLVPAARDPSESPHRPIRFRYMLPRPRSQDQRRRWNDPDPKRRYIPERAIRPARPCRWSPGPG